MTNWGAHGLDQVQWVLGMDSTGRSSSSPAWTARRRCGLPYANGVTVRLEMPAGRT